MVALSASRLVWPAIAWISPITSPMRLAAVASCDMVSTVRCASMTARLATSVEVAAWPAISPIEAASSSAELAAEVTFIEAAPTRSSAARDSADTASAAPLSAVEAVSSRSAAPRTLASASSMVFSNRAIMPATASVRRSRSRTDFSCVTESCSRSSALSRNTITVRAIAPISSRASVAGMSTEVSPVARRFIAPDSLCSGLVMPRPMRKFRSEADADDRDADADDQQLGLRLRGGDALGRLGRLAPGGRDDLVGGGQHLARFRRDDRGGAAKSCRSSPSMRRRRRCRSSPDRSGSASSPPRR